MPATHPKAKTPAAEQHFTLKAPRYHDSPLVLLCPCGHRYETAYLDSRTLPELNAWYNAHRLCQVPGQEQSA